MPTVLIASDKFKGSLTAVQVAERVTAGLRRVVPELQVESLYFSFLGRRPTIPETATAGRALKDGLALAELTWVLFNSREFIFIQ